MSPLESLQYDLQSHLRINAVRQENATNRKIENVYDGAYWSGLLHGLRDESQTLRELLEKVNKLVQKEQNPPAGDSNLSA